MFLHLIKGLIRVYPHVIISVLIVSTCDLNFITLPTCGGLYLSPLPTSPISIKKKPLKLIKSNVIGIKLVRVQNLNRRTLAILYIDSSKHQLNASYILKKWKLASSGIDYREGERLLNWG